MVFAAYQFVVPFDGCSPEVANPVSDIHPDPRRISYWASGYTGTYRSSSGLLAVSHNTFE
jgi:hypothetical protein